MFASAPRLGELLENDLMKQKSGRHAVLASLLGAAAPWAAAGLLGSNVDVRYHLTGLPDTSDVVTVAAGVEITCPGAANLCTMLTAPTQTVDIGDSSIHYDYTSTDGQSSGFNNVAVNGFDFQMLQFGAPLVDFVLSTDIVGLDDSRITLTANRLEVDMRGLGVGFAGFFHIDLIGASVSEPPVVALLAAALVGLGLRAKARRQG